MHSDGVFSSLLPPTSIIFFKSQYTSCYKVSHLGNWLISHSKSHSYSYYCNIPISNFILPFSSWIAAFQLKWLLFSCHFPSLDSQIFPLHCQYLNNFHLRLLAFRFLSLLSRLSFFHGCFLNFLFIFILVANLFDWLFFISGRHLCQSCTSHVRSFFFTSTSTSNSYIHMFTTEIHVMSPPIVTALWTCFFFCKFPFGLVKTGIQNTSEIKLLYIYLL